MIENRTTLLEGKSTVIKNKQYLSTKDYCQPFFDRMDSMTSDYIIQVKPAEQVSGTTENPDTIYNRVHIQAILPQEDKSRNYNTVVGFIYGLDLKTPVAKFYVADIDRDGNLFNFSLNRLNVQEIEEATAINYAPIKDLLEMPDSSALMEDQLEKTTYSNRVDIIGKLGEWIDYTLNNYYVNEGGKIKLSTSMPIDAYKSLVVDKESNFYVDERKSIMFLNVYKSFADLIKHDKDIINTFEKTYLLSKMLGL